MKMLLFLALFGLSSVAFAQNAQTDYQQADKKLNAVYQQILKDYSKNPVFISKLKLAQRAWIISRDADFLMKFPYANTSKAQLQYGSVFPDCKAQFYKAYTDARIKTLTPWLKSAPFEEGDVCAGSVHSFN